KSTVPPAAMASRNEPGPLSSKFVTVVNSWRSSSASNVGCNFLRTADRQERAVCRVCFRQRFNKDISIRNLLSEEYLCTGRAGRPCVGRSANTADGSAVGGPDAARWLGIMPGLAAVDRVTELMCLQCREAKLGPIYSRPPLRSVLQT